MPSCPHLKHVLQSLLLTLLLAACSPSDQAQTWRVQSTASSGPTAVVQLPDFTALVRKEGPAVVNISSTQTVLRQPFQMPELSPDDPFYEFFRHFMPPQTGPREYQTQSLGSGFIISQDGYILTNRHVVKDADEVTVRLTDKREFKAKVVGTDARSDVALIKINARALPTVAIGDSSKLKVGEWVVAIGSPFGFTNSVTAGIVSAEGRSLPDEDYVPFIQTDVALNPGSSGGPLFNLSGQVVGINSQIYSRTGGYMGLSFAVPINIAMEVADQLRAHGKVVRGRIGVQIQELSPELAASFGLKSTNGALVAGVEKGSPAEKAGLRAGDVILKFNGKPITDSTELPLLVANSKPGSGIRLDVWHQGATKEVTVVVAELPSEQAAARKESAGGGQLGLVVSDLTPDQKRQLGITQGVLVQDVQGAALQAGIQPGDVILALNNNPVSSAAQFRRLLAQISRGATVALLVQRDDTTFYVPLKPRG